MNSTFGAFAKLMGKVGVNLSDKERPTARRGSVEAEAIAVRINNVVVEVERDNAEIEKLVDELAAVLSAVEDVHRTNDSDTEIVEQLMEQVYGVQSITDDINDRHGNSSISDVDDSDSDELPMPTIDELSACLADLNNLRKHLKDVKGLIYNYKQSLENRTNEFPNNLPRVSRRTSVVSCRSGNSVVVPMTRPEIV